MPTSPRIDLSGRRILVAEDEYTIAAEILDALELRGAEVVGPAPTVARALELVQAERLDGAVLDINLKGELAFSVADALVERNIRFVFTTGYDPGIVPERHRGVPRCEKPQDPAAVVQLLVQAMTG
jgi:CheY-like chemotaxis protein